MRPKKLVRFVVTLPIIIAVCGAPLYGRRLDSHPPFGVAARAAAATSEAARTAIAVQLLPPPTAVGTFVTFDVPGAVNGTTPVRINNSGVITGGYGDNVGSGFHGFIRAADGSFVTFDVPGAVNATFPSAINDGGDTAGFYGDNVGSGFHGFIRGADGSFVT